MARQATLRLCHWWRKPPVFVLEPKSPGQILGGSTQCCPWGRWVGGVPGGPQHPPYGMLSFLGRAVMCCPVWLFLVAWHGQLLSHPWDIGTKIEERCMCGLIPRTMKMSTGNSSSHLGSHPVLKGFMPKAKGATSQVLSHLEVSVPCRPMRGWWWPWRDKGFLTSPSSCLVNL